MQVLQYVGDITKYQKSNYPDSFWHYEWNVYNVEVEPMYQTVWNKLRIFDVSALPFSNLNSKF